MRFNTLLWRNQQFEANFPPYLFKKERLRDWALNACDVNPVSCSQSCYCRDTGLTSYLLLGPVPHKARFLLREPGFWSLVKNWDWAQIPFCCLFLPVTCFYFLKRKILAMGYGHFKQGVFLWQQGTKIDSTQSVCMVTIFVKYDVIVFQFHLQQNAFSM